MTKLNISGLIQNLFRNGNKKRPLKRAWTLKGGKPVDYSFLDNGEIIATDYGFINNKGIEVCSEYELGELDG